MQERVNDFELPDYQKINDLVHGNLKLLKL